MSTLSLRSGELSVAAPMRTRSVEPPTHRAIDTAAQDRCLLDLHADAAREADAGLAVRPPSVQRTVLPQGEKTENCEGVTTTHVHAFQIQHLRGYE
jgi:hypothetical protein